MKFKYKTQRLNQIVFIAMTVIAGFSLVVTILRMCGVTLYKLEVGSGIIICAMYALIGVLALLFATLSYKLTTDKLQLKLGFVDLNGGKIKTENIVNAVMMDGKLYISYIGTALDPIIVEIAVKSDKMKEFCDELKKLNDKVEVFEK